MVIIKSDHRVYLTSVVSLALGCSTRKLARGHPTKRTSPDTQGKKAGEKRWDGFHDKFGCDHAVAFTRNGNCFCCANKYAEEDVQEVVSGGDKNVITGFFGGFTAKRYLEGTWASKVFTTKVPNQATMT